ncbi:hypothetical protein J6590_091080 [Homalodisca vitripennis]|nr:hypothetical protein J6590_091080 [Homalodisca vitripennis]
MPVLIDNCGYSLIADKAHWTGNQLIGLRSDPASLEREKQSVQSWRFEEKVYRSS